jgi:hypothetical protein
LDHQLLHKIKREGGKKLNNYNLFLQKKEKKSIKKKTKEKKVVLKIIHRP